METPGRTIHLEWESGLRFPASGTTADGTVTEILAPRLGARWPTPHPNEYRTQAFVAFPAEGREVFVPILADT